MDVDANGALWAWQDVAGGDRADAVVTGSHLDSVPGGGAFDGPLGVVSALAAVDLLRARRHAFERPLAVVVFPREEGSRFGLACLGSSLLTGAVTPERALNQRDENGEPWPTCRAPTASTPTAWARIPRDWPGSEPSSSVDIWLDIRHPDDAVGEMMRRHVECRTPEIAAAEGCVADLTTESYSPTAHFDPGHRDRLAAALSGAEALATVLEELTRRSSISTR